MRVGGAARDNPFLLASSLFFGVVFLYWRTTGFSFLRLDDFPYVVNNPLLGNGLSPASIGAAFTTVYENYFIPVTWLSYMADAELFGPDAGGFHLTNMLLHALNAALVFIFFNLATREPKKSFLAAALFAVHPLRVEAVAWVASRKELLCTFFSLAALIFYADWGKRRSKALYAAVLFAMLLALLSKPLAVVLPLLFLATDLWPLGRREVSGAKALIIEKIPFFALAALFSAVTAFNQSSSLANAAQVPYPERASFVATTYLHYLQKSFWPLGLSLESGIYTPRMEGALALVGLALLLALTWFAVKKRESFPASSSGWLWFLAALLPVCGLLPVGTNLVADRFTYLPHIGLMAAIVWGGASLAGRFEWPSAAVAALSAALVFSLLLASNSRVGQWRDGVTLFEAQAAATNSPYSKTLLADEYSARGRFGDAARLLDEAIRQNTSDFITQKAISDFALRLYDDWTVKSRMGAAFSFDYAGTLDHFGRLLGEMGIADVSGVCLRTARLIAKNETLPR